MSDNDALRVCMASPRFPPAAETFVRAHRERLPGTVQSIWGLDLEQAEGTARPVAVWQWLARLVPGRRNSRPMQAVWTRAMARFLKRSDFDVVLAEYGTTGARLTPACERAGVPLVVHFHGYDAYRYRTTLTPRHSYKRMLGMCRFAVAVSHDMARQLRELGAPADTVRYNAYGVDCDLFRPTDPAANAPVFLGVGRFVEKKAPHLTVLAFQRVLQACPEARLRLIGGGPLLPVCRDLVRGLGMGDAVELPGAVSHAGVAEAMCGARAFVQHSMRAADGDCEGNPVAVIEAGAAGLPVVATRHAGIPEAVLDGCTGLLVDERDIEAMADRMIELARDPELASRLGRAGRERVRAEFSMAKSIERLASILAEAAKR